MKSFPFAIALWILLLSACSSGPVYYGYSSIGSQKIAAGNAKSPSYHIDIVPAMIKDPNIPTNLTLEIGFSGEYQYYPRGLEFELYEANKRIPLDKADLTVTTVLNDRVSYFKLKESTSDVEALIAKLKADNNIPESVKYFSLAGRIAGPLGPTNCPPKLKLKLRIKTAGGATDKEIEFELGTREYGKASNRPFG